jgi:hypothetical protein
MPTPRKNTDSPQPSLNRQTSRIAEEKTSAPKSMNPAHQTETQDQTTLPVKAPLKNIPVWADWNKRHTVSLFKAICLAHNITPNRKTLEKLREKTDARTLNFQNHLNTLKDNVRHDPALIGEASKSKVKPTDDTRIILKPFIDWVKNSDPFPGLSIPPDFFAITPLIPVAVPSPNINQALTEKAAESVIKKTSTVASTENIKLNKRWAQIMIAMAVDKYKLVPIWPTSELRKFKRVHGLYGPVSELCQKYKLRGSTDRTTVRDAFLDALDLLGEAAVTKLINAIDDPKKSA